IPDTEAVGGWVELGVRRDVTAQRIQIGYEMPANSIVVNELDHRGFLGHFVELSRASTRQRNGVIGLRMNRLMRYVQIREEEPVEIIFALQQTLQAAEKHSGFGALNHAVIVSARDHHDLTQTNHGA